MVTAPTKRRKVYKARSALDSVVIPSATHFPLVTAGTSVDLAQEMTTFRGACDRWDFNVVTWCTKYWEMHKVG